ncbi:MAG: hypothetical protein QNL43_03355 [Crocinitomicaceae bacterium]|jgi:hypothetical protein|tara:strand:+ start:9501 stop:9761 length:261 start_codon:yes stop_codon:yes gene_type:complete
MYIDKELIPSLSFKDASVIEQHPELTKQLQKAMMLGNTHKRKVKIVFQDDEGVKKVDTTLWASGSKFVCLKGGVWIPINRLIEIVI